MRIKNWDFKISWSHAIIELVLITVGLFMAIQIENWRENIKEKLLEKKLLGEIKVSLEFEPRTSAFENLKSTNINLISNDDLRLKLVDLYDFTYQRTLRIIDNVINIYRKNRILPYMEEHLEFSPRMNEENNYWPNLFIPEEILVNKEFHNILTNIYFSYSNTLQRLTSIEKKILQLLQEIDAELGS